MPSTTFGSLRQSGEERILNELIGPAERIETRKATEALADFHGLLRSGERHLSVACNGIKRRLKEPLRLENRYSIPQAIPGTEIKVDPKCVEEAEVAKQELNQAILAFRKWKRHARYTDSVSKDEIKEIAIDLAKAHLCLGLAYRSPAHLRNAVSLGHAFQFRFEDEELILRHASSTGYKTPAKPIDIGKIHKILSIVNKHPYKSGEELNSLYGIGAYRIYNAIVSGLEGAALVAMLGLGIFAIGDLIITGFEALPPLVEEAIGGALALAMLILGLALDESSSGAESSGRVPFNLSSGDSNWYGATGYEIGHPGQTGYGLSPANRDR